MKKKRKSPAKKSYKGIFDRVLESLFTSIEENAEDLLENLGDFVFIKSIFKKYMTFFVISSAAFVIFLLGVALLILDQLNTVKPWIVYIGLGILIYLVGWIYLKSK